MKRWYDRIGNTIEMNVGGKWIKGIVINGERTNDGIINMKTLDGKKYWCGVGTEHIAFRKCDDSDGDLITNADRIRSMSDEELAEFLVGLNRHCLAWLGKVDCSAFKYCEGNCQNVVSKWLQSEAE